MLVTDICQETIKTWKFVGLFILIVKIIIPIVIIVTGIALFFKAITKGDSNSLTSSAISLF